MHFLIGLVLLAALLAFAAGLKTARIFVAAALMLPVLAGAFIVTAEATRSSNGISFGFARPEAVAARDAENAAQEAKVRAERDAMIMKAEAHKQAVAREIEERQREQEAELIAAKRECLRKPGGGAGMDASSAGYICASIRLGDDLEAKLTAERRAESFAEMMKNPEVARDVREGEQAQRECRADRVLAWSSNGRACGSYR